MIKNRKCKKLNSVVQKDIDSMIASCRYIEQLQDVSVLITGATGLIARYLTTFLLELNRQRNTKIRVFALVRNLEKAEMCFAPYLEEKNLVFVHQDVCESINFPDKVEYIFHAAGDASASSIRNNPIGIMDANTTGTKNVLEFARKKEIKKILFPSTREIYGKVEGVESISETDMGTMNPIESRNCYPESKRMAEAMLEGYRTQYGINYNILRIAHTYGPTMSIENDGRVMADFIGAVVNKQDIVLNSDGTALRSFCYVTDTIEGIMDVWFKGEKGGAYNLANEREPMAIKDVAAKLAESYSDRGVSVAFANPDDEVKKGYVGYKITGLNTSKIEKLGWLPKVKLEEGLQRTVEYFLEERESK